MPIETYQAVVTGNSAGQFVQTVWHFLLDNTSSLDPFSAAADLSEALDSTASVLGKMVSALPEDYHLLSLRIKRVSTPGGPTNIRLVFNNCPTDGERSGEQQSTQVNPCVIWIPQDDPDKLGRTFLPGASEDDIDQMQFSPALVTAIDEMITAFKTPADTPNASMNYQGVIWRKESSTRDIITNGYLSPLIGTQRRRLRPV